MPQFSLQRLFVSVTLIAAGCGALAALARWHATLSTLSEQDRVTSKMPSLILVGFVLIGVGIGNLFKRPVVGGLWGFLVLMILCVCFVVFFRAQ